MRTTSLWDRVAVPGKPKPERRHHVRFPIALLVRYRLAKSSGWGQIVNIGSGGALFTIHQTVTRGDAVKLCIDWPVLLHENIHLNLIAEGPIVRVEEGHAVVRFKRCSFRTASAAFRRQARLRQLRGGAPPHG
jgi:hypothetical protein